MCYCRFNYRNTCCNKKHRHKPVSCDWNCKLTSFYFTYFHIIFNDKRSLLFSFFLNSLSSFFFSTRLFYRHSGGTEGTKGVEGGSVFFFFLFFFFFFKTSSIKDKESESRRGGRRGSETEKQTRREEEKRWDEKSFWEEDRSGGVQVLQCPGESASRWECVQVCVCVFRCV